MHPRATQPLGQRQHPTALRPSPVSRHRSAPGTGHDAGADGAPAPGASVDIERAWVARSRSGDVDAFESIFRRYYEHLCLFAERLLRSPDSARDAVQDVFVAIWRQKASCQGCDNLRVYLFTAVRNRVLKLLRHRNVVNRTRARMALEHRSPGHGAAPETPEEESDARELAAAVERIIQQLPERSREAYLLHRRDGLSYAEIAAVMDVSVRTVENHIARALRGLREGLSDWIS
ncbi:MAG TPA: RNA polymerase sigma-70 factor [Gemmatimonadaceae bacterium]